MKRLLLLILFSATAHAQFIRNFNSTSTASGGCVPNTSWTDITTPAFSVCKNGSWLTLGVGLGTIGGSGTAGRIARFTAGSTLGDASLSDNGTAISVLTGKTFAIADITPGSILFGGASGLVSQDNANLFHNTTDATNRYGLKLGDVSGATNNYTIKTGLGDVELGDKLSQLNTPITFSATPTFSAILSNHFSITLTDNVTSSTLSGAVTANYAEIITFLICQDVDGTNTFVWPTNVFGGMTISTTASKCNAQEFRYDGTNAYALSSGVTGM